MTNQPLPEQACAPARSAALAWLRSEPGLLLLLFTFAAVARLVAAMQLGGGFHFVDETDYFDTARRILAGGGFGATYSREPVFPLFLSALSAIAPGNVLALRMLHAVAAALGTVLIFRLGRLLFGTTAAAFAALVYAFDPLLVVTGALFYAESLAAMTLLAALLAALTAWRNDRIGWSLLAGLLLGVVAQLRAVALVIPPLFIAWAVLATPLPVRRRLLHASALALALLLALLPWTYRNYRVHGRLVTISRSAQQNTPKAWRSYAWNNGVGSSLLRRAYDDPSGFADRTLRQFGYFWELRPTRLETDTQSGRDALHAKDRRLPRAPSFNTAVRDNISAISFGAELLLAFAGLAVAWRRRSPAVLLLVAVPIGYALGYSLFFAKMRYRVMVLPELFLLTGLGAALVWEFWRGMLPGGYSARTTPPPAPSDRRPPIGAVTPPLERVEYGHGAWNRAHGVTHEVVRKEDHTQ
ncbi:MAG: glycosyltransferase family 39 protein [Deltaproteobacteria bacterium]|nr:glycosyltransferase family 39 protein [Deltaproteobacteria bacterium]